VTLTAPTAKGNAAILASSGGSTGSVNIAFVSGPAANITLTLSPSTIAPGGIVTINVTVADQFNNLLPAGQAVNFASSTGSVGSSAGGTFGAASTNTNLIGETSTTYTAGTCATNTCTDILTVTAGLGALTTINLPVISSSTSIASIAVVPGTASITGDGASYTNIRATVKNTAATGVQGVLVNFANTAGTLSSTAPAITPATTANTDADGVAQLYLFSPIAIGNATVTASTSGFSNSVIVSFVPGVPAVIGLNAKPTTVQPGGTTILTAAVIDANGFPVGSGQTVNLSTTSATGGFFASVSALTDGNGRINVTYTAGTCTCIEVLTARTTNGISNTQNLTVSSGASVLSSLAIASTTSSITADGASPTTINATVKDASGGVPGVVVSFATTGGTLSATSAATDANGIATVTLTSAVKAMVASVTASASGFSSKTDVTFVAGAPVAVGINAAPNVVQPSTTNSPGTSTINASVLDGNGNPVANEMVTFTFTATGSGAPKLGQFGTTPLLTTVSVPTDSSGLVEVAYVAGAGSGTDTVKAATANGTNSSIGISVSTSSVVVGSIATTANNSSIPVNGTTTIRAVVKDTGGAVMPNVAVTFTVSAGALSLPNPATTDANGVAQVTLTASGSLLTATVTGSAGGFSSSTSVVYTAGVPNTVAVFAAPTTVNTGGSSTITAYVVDASNNPVSGELMTFAFTAHGSGLPVLGSATAVTNVNGLATIAYTAGSTGGPSTDTIKATTSNAMSGTVSVTVSTSASVVSGLTLIAGATTLPADGASTALIRATVTNTSGAPAVGVTVNFTTTAGSIGASAITDTSGTAQVSLTSSVNLGTATVIADASGFTRTVSVNFVAGSPSAVALSASPASVSAGANSTIKATAIDAIGNPVTGQTVTFSISTNTSGATLTPVTAVTNADGVATTTYTAGSATGSDTLKASLTNGINNTTIVLVTASTSPTANAITLSASPSTVKSDNSNAAIVTVTALSGANAVISNVVVTLGVDTGVLSAQTVTTGVNGQATFTYSSGSTSQYNRTGSITATAGATTKTLLVPITGSTMTITTATSSINTSTPTVLTVTAKDAGGNPVSGQTIKFTVVSGSGTLSVATAATDTSGVATVSFTGTAAGAASVKADWMSSPTGTITASATQLFNVVATGGTVFQLTSPASSPFAVTLGAVTTSVAVDVPDHIGVTAVAFVRFSTSLGTWQTSGTKTQTDAFVATGNYAEIFLAGANAGNANVQIDALDASGAILSSAQTVLSLSASAASATQISLQANVTSISPSSGSTSSTATLTAMVRDASGNPVGNAPVLFELLNPTGSGEQVSPTTVMTAATAANGVAVGQAQSTFTAGTLPTTQASQIQASVIGTAVSSTTTITVGGTAGSIAIGTSSGISSVNSDTAYQLPVTVLVTDSNGNAVSGAVVSLSVWGEAYAKGVRGPLCNVIYDGPSTTIFYAYANEDTNENLILDPGEDVDGAGGGCGGCQNLVAPSYGTTDGILWPPSSAAGSVPQTVTTDADGLVTFNLTYLKDYASWLKVRLRARTGVQGTETTSVHSAWLGISEADSKSPCPLGDSPFN
jgi:protocatechuate 3,4-dioxygenase beta subunit